MKAKNTIKREQRPNLFEALPSVSNLREANNTIKREQRPNLFEALPSVSNLRETKNTIKREQRPNLFEALPSDSNLREANNKVSVLFLLAGILFAACMLIANILASKIVMIGSWSAPAGVIVFPLAYIVNDVIAEVWGYGRARLIIWAGFGVNLLAALFYMAAIALPPAPYYEGQEAFRMILGSSVRIVLASLTAYLVGSFVNAFIMSRFKLMTKGRGFPLRAIVSTVAGEGIDSLIFITVAFAGIFPPGVILTMIGTQALMKIAYEAAVLPVTILVVKTVKRMEGEDVFDHDISYNPFHIKQI